MGRSGTKGAVLPRFCYHSVGIHCSSTFTIRSQKRHSLASVYVNYAYNKLPVERMKSPLTLENFRVPIPPCILDFLDLLWHFTLFLSVPSYRWWNSALQGTIIASFHILTTSSSTINPSGLCSWKNSVTNPRISPLHTPAPQMFSKNSRTIPPHIDVLYATFTASIHACRPGSGGPRKYAYSPCILRDTTRF
jgi:hypothetical protein